MEARALAMYTTFSATLMHVHWMSIILYDCMYKYTTYAHLRLLFYLMERNVRYTDTNVNL